MTGENASEPVPGALDRPVPGVFIFGAVVASVFAVTLIAGTALSGPMTWFVEYMFMMPFLFFLQGLPVLLAVVFEYLLSGLVAVACIVLPYLLIYFLLMSLLQECGYLNRANVMFQKLSASTGYPCLAITPYVMGLGCTLAGFQALEYAPEKRFRILTAPLLCAAPCSAKAVIIIGLVMRYAGVVPALVILAVDLVLVLGGILLLARFARPQGTGEVKTALAPLRVPRPKGTLNWFKWHLRGFGRVALPAIVLGSIIVGLLRYIGILSWTASALDPAAGLIFGIPGLALVFLFVGVLRKELGIALFALVGGFTLSTLMTAPEIFVFGLMSTVLVPCWGAVFMLFRMFGPRQAGLMLLASVGLTVVVGVAAGAVVRAVGW